MSTLPHQVKNVEAQADISKMKTEGDGSFKRKASTFRNFIAPNGEFAPEKGGPCCSSTPLDQADLSQDAIISIVI